MISSPVPLPAVLEQSPVKVVFGSGALSRLGELAGVEGARRVLLVTDPGIVRVGLVERALESLGQAGIDVATFDGVHENPTTEHVAIGLGAARSFGPDFFVALGGGSSMDCAKAVNLLLTNGGSVADYWGVNKASRPMLPMIAVPTTAGTGSEAQSFALISDADMHRKMACGDRRLPSEGGLRPRVAVLDPDLTASVPAAVARAAGIDAVAHAVESSGSTARTSVSREFSREAWNLLVGAFEPSLTDPQNEDARARMLLGAHLAGAAIEYSMLGAAHACANPLTAVCGLTHGLAVGLMLPHVIRFNTAGSVNPYVDLGLTGEELASTLVRMLASAGLPRALGACGVKADQLSELARLAAEQWTAGFNPRPVGEPELLAIYRAAM